MDGTELLAHRSLRLVPHSPTGFNWGYGGSGPAQLSLAILLDHTDDDDFSLRWYQQLKWDKVCGFSMGSSWELTADELDSWIQDRGV